MYLYLKLHQPFFLIVTTLLLFWPCGSHRRVEGQSPVHPATDGSCKTEETPHNAPLPTIRVAAVSFVPIKFDIAANAVRLEQAFRDAADGGARLAVAPEGALDGYVVNQIIAGEHDAQRMNLAAVTMDDPLIVHFRELAVELQLCIVFGLAERIESDVFNCAVFIDSDGSIAGKYHKMQLAEGYHDSWWFNRLGKHSRAFDTSLGRCGILICNDRWNPQLAQIPVADGAQFLVIPAYGTHSRSQDDAVLARSRESGLPVIEANVGVTLIADGQEIIAVDRQREGITFAEIRPVPARPVDIATRDRVEADFLQWRQDEMKVRYRATLRKQESRQP